MMQMSWAMKAYISLCKEGRSPIVLIDCTHTCIHAHRPSESGSSRKITHSLSQPLRSGCPELPVIPPL